MKAALSIVLAALLVILLIEQVLAQAVQQEAVSVQQTAPPHRVAHLFRVPPLTQNTALLWGTPPDVRLVEGDFGVPCCLPDRLSYRWLVVAVDEPRT